jgi:hypothetical protein
MADLVEIEKRIDRAIAAPIQINAEVGGVALENMGQVMEFAKLMSVSGAAVPKYLRGNAGACLAICSRALRWQMDPFAVAEKSYMVVNKGEERIAFEAQLVHAVITARAPLKARLRTEIGHLANGVWTPGSDGGDERRCKVWGTFRGEDKPHEYTSEPLGKMREARGRNEYGTIKGSPLWDTMPEVQLAYSSVRQWCRLHASEVLLGVYTPDELEDGSQARDVTAVPQVEGLAARLRAAKLADAKGRGFDAAHVQRQASARTVIEGDANSGEAKQEDEKDERDDGAGTEPDADAGRQGDTVAVGDDAGDKGAGADAGGTTDEAGGKPAGDEAAPAADQSEVFPPDRDPKPKGKGKRR